MSTRDVVIPVSAAFEKRLAELVWENCPDLARQTAAGKLALSVDVDAKEIQKMVVATLVPALAKSTQTEVAKSLKSSIGSIVERVTEAIETRSQKDMEGRLDRGIEKAVQSAATRKIDALVEDRVKRGVDEYFGNHFASGLQYRIECLVRDHLESRLNHGKPCVIMQDAEQKVRKAQAGT